MGCSRVLDANSNTSITNTNAGWCLHDPANQCTKLPTDHAR